MVRFPRLLSLDAADIEARLRVTPAQLGPAKGDAIDAIELARKLYMPTPDSIELTRRLIQRSNRLQAKVYPSVHAFKRGLFGEGWEDVEPQMICLTGLGGVGKSALLGRLHDLWNEGGPVMLRTADLEAALHPCACSSINRRQQVNSVIRSLLPDPRVMIRKDETLTSHVRKFFRANGVLLHVVDELQFMSLTDKASATLADLLMALLDLKVPTAYAMNFNALKKLQRRPKHERDRFIGDIVQVDPFAPTDQRWHLLLADVDQVLGKHLDFRLSEEPVRIWELTFGLPRSLFDLLAAAAEHTTKPLRRIDLLNAFESDQLLELRKSVMLLHASLGRLSANQRKEAEVASLISPVRALTSRPESAAFDRMGQPSVMAQLTAGERSVVKGIRGGVDRASDLVRGKAQPRSPSDPMRTAMTLARVTPPG